MIVTGSYTDGLIPKWLGHPIMLIILVVQIILFVNYHDYLYTGCTPYDKNGNKVIKYESVKLPNGDIRHRRVPHNPIVYYIDNTTGETVESNQGIRVLGIVCTALLWLILSISVIKHTEETGFCLSSMSD